MPDKTITLATKLSPGDFTIDADKGVLHNVSIITAGPALGHGFDIDATMLQQVAAGINANKAGVKSRLTHPGGIFGGRDPIEVMLGRVKNARVESGKVRGDLHIGAFAAKSPAGNLREFVLGVAGEDPEMIGLSIVFEPGTFEERIDPTTKQSLPPAGRVDRVLFADVVGDPAANPAGFLSKLNENDFSFSSNKLNPTAASAATETPSLTLEFVMPTSDKAAETAASTPVTSNPAPAVDLAKVQAEATALAHKRVADIKGIAELAGLGAQWALDLIDDPTKTVEDAKAAALAARKAAGKTIPAVQVGEDVNLSTIDAAISDAVVLRAGFVKLAKPHERSAQFRGHSLIDMGRHWLAAHGVKDAFQLSKHDVVNAMSGAWLRRHRPDVSLAQGTGNFTSVLADAINKTLRQAYVEAPSTWQQFCSRRTNPDYKLAYRNYLSEAPSLTTIKEGEGIQYITLSDGKETVTLVEKNAGIRLTRRAIVNDDLGAFMSVPAKLGQSAKRAEEDAAYSVITTNAAMADTGTLFNATAVTTAGGHANYTSSGTAMSVTSLDVGFAAVMKQKGPKLSGYLNLEPKLLIVPVAKRGLALQLINSTVDPAKNNSATNPYSGRLQVIANARLDANSATAWYLACLPSEFDGIEMTFLEGEEEPVLAQETDFDTEDQKFKVRHSVVATAIDWRGFYKNAGA